MPHFHEVRPIPEQAPGTGHLAPFANCGQPSVHRHARNLCCVTEKRGVGANRKRLRSPGVHGFKSCTVSGWTTDRKKAEFYAKVSGKRLHGSSLLVLLRPI